MIGFTKAESLQVGSMISHANKESSCKILSIEREASEQTYFGLNCLESEVTANDIHVSTFGHLHSLPAVYMKVVGRIFGIKVASDTGSWLADTFLPLIQKFI